MNFLFEISCTLSLAFASVSQAYAQADPSAPAQPGFAEVFSKMTPMFAIVFLIFYFMVIKPQQAKLKAQQDLMAALKKGDQVVTSGGIFARVASLEEDCVILDIGSNVKMKVEKTNIAKKIELNLENAKTAA